MEFQLTPKLEKAVDAALAAGYPSPEAYIAEAIEHYYQLKLSRLEAALAVGYEQLERGEGIEVEDLDSFFEEISDELDHELGSVPKDA